MRRIPSNGTRTHRTATLPLRDDGGLRIVVVSDTHGNPHPAAAERVVAEKPDAILHAGDIGEAHVLRRLASIAPIFAVRGNIDIHAADTPDVLTLEIGAGGLKLLLLHMAVVGTKIYADVAQLARNSGASLVVCGHSHVPFIGRDRGLTVFNPGSVGPRRFGLPIVFGVINIENGALTMRHVDCETGQTWSP